MNWPTASSLEGVVLIASKHPSAHHVIQEHIEAAAQSMEGRPVDVATRLVFVGTGGGAHIERCHLCIAAQFSPDDTLLLDTGGGFQILRNLKRAGIDLASVHSIFLSHRHSDHIGGLEPLLLHMGLHALATGRRSREVAVYAHPTVIQAGKTLLEIMASAAPMLFQKTGEELRWVPLLPEVPVVLRSGLALTPFTVDHEPRDGASMGCRLEFMDGGRTWSAVYSGDTRPTPALRRHSEGADILMHEAGGVDSHAEMVHVAGHSTAGEAARTAAEAGVQRLYLTHLPHEQVVHSVLEEARRFYTGPIAAPDDLDSLDLRELAGTEPDVP